MNIVYAHLSLVPSGGCTFRSQVTGSKGDLSLQQLEAGFWYPASNGGQVVAVREWNPSPQTGGQGQGSANSCPSLQPVLEMSVSPAPTMRLLTAHPRARQDGTVDAHGDRGLRAGPALPTGSPGTASVSGTGGPVTPHSFHRKTVGLPEAWGGCWGARLGLPPGRVCLGPGGPQWFLPVALAAGTAGRPSGLQALRLEDPLQGRRVDDGQLAQDGAEHRVKKRAVPEEADLEDQLGLRGRRAVSTHEPLEHSGREAAIPSCRGLTWERQVKALKRSKSTKQVTGSLSTGVPEPAGPQKGDPWKDPLPTEEKRVSSDWIATVCRLQWRLSGQDDSAAVLSGPLAKGSQQGRPPLPQGWVFLLATINKESSACPHESMSCSTGINIFFEE